MKKGPKPYNAFQLFSAVFMILALVWLTISLPIVNEAKQQQTSFVQMTSDPANTDGNEEDTNPFSNTTEEKNPNANSSLSEEYLHDHHELDALFLIASQNFIGENIDTYIAFHGELHVPPPNVA